MKKTLSIAAVALVLLAMLSACGSSLTFRAEVLPFDPTFYHRNEDSLLFVTSITAVRSHPVGGRYFVLKNDYITVRGINGEAISHQDIPPGAIVDIRYSGAIGQSGPALIFNANRIQVVELP